MDPTALDLASREQLIEHARRLGVTRPELLTRVELKDEIVRRSISDEPERRRARGWLGVARDLLASVVEQGLHLPDAAALIRGDVRVTDPVPARPVATVTLAEIYATQGHVSRALRILDEVLVKEPDHEAARALRDRLGQTEKAVPRAENGNGAAPLVEPPFAALLRSEERALIYWELGSRGEPAHAGLRVFIAVPSWDGATKEERALALDESSGVTELAGIPKQAVVRVALGSDSADRFTPLAVAIELTRGGEVAWQPSSSKLDDAATRARERALRALVERAS
jgi:hypothetical protein